MRKLWVVCCVLLSTLMAQGGNYGYLVFTNTGGSVTAFGVNNLRLTVSGNALQVTNDEGTVNMELTDLASMQFATDGMLGTEQILNGDEPVQVFSVSGVRLGSYGSLVEAAKQMQAGAYVVSNGSATQKIVVR